MLIAARQAGKATRFAPSQERRTTAESEILGSFSQSMVLWLNPYRTPIQVGSTVGKAPDLSLRQNFITQTTASKQPAMVVKSGVKALLFDAVNDGLVTSSIAMQSSQQLSTFVQCWSTATNAAAIEISTDANAVTNGFLSTRNDTAGGDVVGYYRGNAGIQYKTTSVTFSSWASALILCDKSQTAANEMTIKVNNVAVALRPATTSENTNSFGDYAWNIGSRNNGASLVLNGWLSQVLGFKTLLNSAQQTTLYRAVQNISGLGWT